MKFPDFLNPFKKKPAIKLTEELKTSLKALKDAESKVLGMLDEYVREKDVDTVAFILDKTQFSNFEHLLEPKWWGTSVDTLQTGETFLLSLIQKLQGERRDQTGAAITEFNLAILRIKARNKPIRFHRSK